MNCLNCGALNPPSKSSKPRKYCSAKCTRLFYKKEGRYIYNKNNYLSKKDIERRAKQKEEFEYAQKHYIRKDDAAEKLNIATSALYHRAKKANIESFIVYEKGRQRTYYKPEDIKKLQINEPDIPEGYITADKAAEYIGVTTSSFWTLGAKRGRKRPDPSVIQRSIGTPGSRRNLYSIKDLDAWLAEGLRLKEERKEERSIRADERRLERELIETERLADIKRRTVDAGLINVEGVRHMFNFKGTHFAAAIPSQKINGRLWFKPEDIKTYKIQREAARAERKERTRARINATIIHRDNAGSDEAYELRKKQAARCKAPDYVYRDAKAMAVWKTHTEPWRMQEEEDIIIELTCTKCEETFPYTKFYIHPRNSKPERYGRSTRCKTCIQKKWLSRGKLANTPKVKTRTRMGSQIATSILRDLSRRNDNYIALNHKLLWKQIKTYLGYTKDEILDHIESQFKPWMTWANNGRPKHVNKPTWQLDHINPKSSFKYTSITDEEFQECWGLVNLRPIESRLNLIKSNKNLRSKFNSTFVQGLKSKKISHSGIWHYLPYTNLDAQKFFENRFTHEMTWKNYGTYWQIDHIAPQAYLSYTDPMEKNFAKCWALKNMVPKLRSENASKGSRYKEKLWFYNNLIR